MANAVVSRIYNSVKAHRHDPSFLKPVACRCTTTTAVGKTEKIYDMFTNSLPYYGPVYCHQPLRPRGGSHDEPLLYDVRIYQTEARAALSPVDMLEDFETVHRQLMRYAHPTSVNAVERTTFRLVLCTPPCCKLLSRRILFLYVSRRGQDEVRELSTLPLSMLFHHLKSGFSIPFFCNEAKASLNCDEIVHSAVPRCIFPSAKELNRHHYLINGFRKT